MASSAANTRASHSQQWKIGCRASTLSRLIKRLASNSSTNCGKAHGGTVARIALAWLLAKPHVTSVIVGASSLSQLEDNLKSVAVQLREAELTKLEEMTAPKTLCPNWFTETTTDPEHKRTLGPA